MGRVEERDSEEINLGVIIDRYLSCIMGLILLFYFFKIVYSFTLVSFFPN